MGSLWRTFKKTFLLLNALVQTAYFKVVSRHFLKKSNKAKVQHFSWKSGQWILHRLASIYVDRKNLSFIYLQNLFVRNQLT